LPSRPVVAPLRLLDAVQVRVESSFLKKAVA
jgi:hypothetical protein